ncbi:MAG: hypothetical protein U0U70_01005 [Chitinophagaceae bacterium]
MKQLLIALTVIITAILFSCTSKQNSTQPDAPAKNIPSPIEGNWETVSFEVNGKPTHPKRVPQQFKMFHDGFFSLLAYNDEGEFAFAGAGTYEVTGNMYKETCTYHSATADIGFTDWQKWEIKGDTLVMYGFEKALMGDGKDITKEVNANGMFVEKRVRAKK